jgi:hypothetical protein
MSFYIPKLIIILNYFYDKNVGIVMNVKNQRLLWDLYVGIAMNVKNQRLLWDLFVGIAYLKMVLWNLE